MTSCVESSLRSCVVGRGLFYGGASLQGRLSTAVSLLSTRVFAGFDFQSKRSIWRFPKGLLQDLEVHEVGKTKSAVDDWIQAIHDEKLDGYQIRRYQNNSIVAHVFNGEISGLNFDENQLQDQDISWLVETFPDLWSLTVKNCDVTDRGISALSKLNLSFLGLERCSKLKGMDLRLRANVLKFKECSQLTTLSNLHAAEVWVSSCRSLKEIKEMEGEKMVLQNCPFPGLSRIKFKELSVVNLSV